MRGSTGPPTETYLMVNEVEQSYQSTLSQAAAPTLLLDSNLKIVFFTPAATTLVNMLAVDMGRPIADLCTTGLGEHALEQAAYVLAHGGALDYEILGPDQRTYQRRITRFEAPGWLSPGILMTFADRTDVQLLTAELSGVRRNIETSQAHHLNTLSTLSHDLRQPLQTLKLLQALLRETLYEVSTLQLTEQIGDTLSAMADTINGMLENTSIAPNTVIPRRVDFQLDTLLKDIGPALERRASESGTVLRIVPCAESIHSDPALLERMLHKLMDIALTHASHDRLLLGCRRHDGWLSLEIRTRGSYVADESAGVDLKPIQRLGAMLGHQLHRRPGTRTGTVYSIRIALSPKVKPGSNLLVDSLPEMQVSGAFHRGIILIVEDDCDLLRLLGTLFHHQGYEVALARDITAALSWIFHSGLKPDLILTDYHLGNETTGLELVATLRDQWHSDVPTIVLTGDVSDQTSFEIAAARCTQLNKPAKLKELLQLVHSMFAQLGTDHLPHHDDLATSSIVYVVDNDEVMRDTVRQILEAEHYRVFDFATCEAFLQAYLPQERACLLLDPRLPSLNGLDLLRRLRQQGDPLPTIILSATGDTAIAVEAMKAGAWDFIEKPCDRNEMLDSIDRALGHSQQSYRAMAGRQGAIDYIASLTTRQRQIMDMVLAGQPSKNIAVDLGISQRTVENHRASIMTRTHSRSIPALARLALAATLQGIEGAKLDT